MLTRRNILIALFLLVVGFAIEGLKRIPNILGQDRSEAAKEQSFEVKPFQISKVALAKNTIHMKTADRAGEQVAFSRLLSMVERDFYSSLELPDMLTPSHCAFRLGITGPPGAGKSTLISEILRELNGRGLRIGVLAIDPTSPFSQGAILGDRIRYSEEGLAGGSEGSIFVRSLGTRGSLGGLSASAYSMLRAFDACNFDFVLIETVGVGQVEVEVMNVVDWVTLVLVPESGDSIQAMKAGVMEIADQFVVNKSDRPGAEILKREVEAHVQLLSEVRGPENLPTVSLVSAIQSQGVREFVAEILARMSKVDLAANRRNPKRLQAEAFALIRANLEDQAKKKLSSIQTPADFVKAIDSLKLST